MTPIYFTSDPPRATLIDVSPAPRAIARSPLPRAAAESRIMHAHDGAWFVEGTGETTIPSNTVHLSYQCNMPRDTYVPIELPPVESLPLLKSIAFHGLPIQSIAEIGNIDACLMQLRSIALVNCPALVIPDLEWLLPMATVYDGNGLPRQMVGGITIGFRGYNRIRRSERDRLDDSITIIMKNCCLRSLRGMEQFHRIAYLLRVDDDGVDLASEIDIIEAYWNSHGGRKHVTGKMVIGGNTVGGRPVKTYHVMPTSVAIRYIRGRMARLGP